MTYHEIRVRPVIRYIITEYFEREPAAHGDCASSRSLGEFDNVDAANRLATALAGASPGVILETARHLKIDWIRGPGEPQEAIRWELTEPEACKATATNSEVTIMTEEEHKRLYGTE